MGDQVTSVLGLGRDVGDALARRFSEHGHLVLAADPSSERIAAARNALPDEIVFYHGELHSRLGLLNAFTATAEAFGRVDNAVIVPDVEEKDRLLDFTQERLEKALAKSARGAALALRVFAERLLEQEDLPTAGVERRAQKGTVTFVLSYAALANVPGHFSASVSQSAILGVMRAGALELAEHAIRVNAIIAVQSRDESAAPWLATRTPLGRAALADEIADAARFLASPEAAFITGQTLVLDGGRSTLSGLLV